MTIDDIESTLSSRGARLEPVTNVRHAAVAMILRETAAGTEMLFIERARHPNDPWSGDLGFPGGKIEPGDDGAKSAAERETLEEVGLDLSQARWLGRLDDLCGAHLPLVVSCFAYAVSPAAQPRRNSEVNAVYWIDLEPLFDFSRHIETRVIFRSQVLMRPAIDLLGPGRTVLWGITYRLVRQLQDRLSERPFRNLSGKTR